MVIGAAVCSIWGLLSGCSWCGHWVLLCSDRDTSTSQSYDDRDNSSICAEDPQSGGSFQESGNPRIKATVIGILRGER